MEQYDPVESFFLCYNYNRNHTIYNEEDFNNTSKAYW